MAERKAKSFKLVVAQVVGEPGELAWSQVLVLPTEDGQELVMALTVEGEGASERGKDLLSRLSEEGAKQLESAKLVDFVRPVVEVTEGVTSFLGVRVKKEKMELVTYGGSRAILKRGDKKGVVIKGKENEWLMGEGEIVKGDRWLMGTAGLMGEISDQLVEDVLGHEGSRQAGEELNTQIYGADENSKVAGVVGYAEEEKESEEVVVVDEGEEEPTIYLKSSNKRRRMALSVGMVLLVLLAVSTWFGWRQREAKRLESRFAEVVAQVESEFSRAEGLQDVVEARRVGNEALAMAESSLGELGDGGALEERVRVTLDEFRARAEKISGESAMGSIPVWYDLTLMREGMVGGAMGFYEGTVYVLDGDRGVVVSVESETKRAEVVAGGDLLAGTSLVTAGPGERLLAYGIKGLIDVDAKRQTTAVLVEPDDEWQRVIGVGLFAGNAYLVDAGTSEVWRYPGLSKGVGAAQRWLGAGVAPDLQEAVDMVIDGDVWVGMKDGAVLRFRRGAKEGYKLTSGADDIEELVAIFTSENSEKVYLLDRGQSRVVVTDKEGAFTKQYVWEGISGVVDMVVDEEVGKIFLLSGSSIYAIDV